MENFVLAIIMVSGFIFTTMYPIARFKQQRSKDLIQYLYIFKYGLIFSTISLFIIELGYIYYILYIDPSCNVLNSQNSKTLSSDKFWIGNSVKSALSFPVFLWALISVLSAWFAGNYYDREKKYANKASELCAQENTLKEKIYDSMDGSLVQITLSNRKVYIGNVMHSQDLERPDTKYIRLFPYMSGYRDPKDLVLKIKTYYIDIMKDITARYSSDKKNVPEDYKEEKNETFSSDNLRNLEEKIGEENFYKFFYTVNKRSLVLPIDQIITMSNFDFEFYNKVNDNCQEKKKE